MKIIYLIGPSGSGKDTVAKYLLKHWDKCYMIPIHTTRKMREGEVNGECTIFDTTDDYRRYLEQGDIVECRSYTRVDGSVLYYYTKDSVEYPEGKEYGVITSPPKGCINFIEYFGSEMIIPIFIHVRDDIRLNRLIRRELAEENPRYDEICRRYLTDKNEEFNDSILAKIKNLYSVANISVEQCCFDIMSIVNNHSVKFDKYPSYFPADKDGWFYVHSHAPATNQLVEVLLQNGIVRYDYIDEPLNTEQPFKHYSSSYWRPINADKMRQLYNSMEKYE